MNVDEHGPNQAPRSRRNYSDEAAGSGLALGAGIGVALGAGVGVALGAAMGNVGLGLSLGVAIGVAIGTAMGTVADERRKAKGGQD